MSRVKTKISKAPEDVTNLSDDGLRALYGAARFRQPWDRFNDLVQAGDSAAAAEFKAAFARARLAWAEHARRAGPKAGMPPWERDGRTPGRPKVTIHQPARGRAVR